MTDIERAVEAVKEWPDLTITPDMAAKVLKCNPNWIRQMAKTRPELLGFPVIRLGARTKIPKVPFLQYLGIDATEK